MVKHIASALSVVLVFFELGAYTFEEEGDQSSMSVCVGLSAATDRPVNIEVMTINGSALGMSQLVNAFSIAHCFWR